MNPLSECSTEEILEELATRTDAGLLFTLRPGSHDDQPQAHVDIQHDLYGWGAPVSHALLMQIAAQHLSWLMDHEGEEDGTE